MQALYSTEDMVALDPMTLQPVTLFNRKANESPTKNTVAPISELGKKLLLKAQEGDTEKVRELMAKGAPFTTDWLGTSPLHWAAHNNHIDTVALLLKAGISRDARNKVERTPMHVAAQEGNYEILQLLIEYGADVDCKDMLRMTPLHWASENGHAECVRLLLKSGADPLFMNKFDKTPERIAFDNNRIDIVQMIQHIITMDPMSRPKKQRKELLSDKATLQATLSISNTTPPREPAEDLGLVTEINFNKAKTKSFTNTSFTKPPVTEIRVMKMSSGKRKILNNEVVEEARVETEMGTIPNPTDKTLQLLQEHGITMLPVDDSNLVASAMQSGQTVVLTEAGKLALNQTGKVINQTQNTLPKIQTVPKVFPFSGKKVIKIRADQLINMTKERKVVIHTDKKFKLNPKRQLDEVSYEEDKQRPSVVELEEVQKQLEEAKKQVEMYKEQYLQKEREAEHYKMQLEAYIIGK